MDEAGVLVDRRSWPTKAELRSDIFDYIEVFYNRERRHKRSPAEYEKNQLNLMKEQTQAA